jgi:hypothetical protein
VHLLSQGSVINTAWEHTLARDPAAMPELSVEIHGPMPLRCLGGRDPLSLESNRWELPPEWTIAICPSDLHGGRAPADYLPQLLDRRATTQRLVPSGHRPR